VQIRGNFSHLHEHDMSSVPRDVKKDWTYAGLTQKVGVGTDELDTPVLSLNADDRVACSSSIGFRRDFVKVFQNLSFEWHSNTIEPGMPWNQ